VQVFNCLNEIIQLIHPQKTLMLAFDGVIPQALMSQERVKRFKYAKRRQKLDNLLASCGNLEKKEIFDINSISPGTEFMNELNLQIKFFIQRKMKEDERWRKVKIFSRIYFFHRRVGGEGFFVNMIRKMINYFFIADSDIFWSGCTRRE